MIHSFEPQITFHGPVAEHNVLCWLCGAKPAVYDMYPNWAFRPCWSCQSYYRSKLPVWKRLVLKMLRLI